MTLLSLSAIVIFAIYHAARQEDRSENASRISFYEKIAVNDAFISQLPAHYNSEQTQALRDAVTDFLNAAWADQVHKSALYEVSNKIETIMADQKIVEKEVQALLTLMQKRREM